MVERPLRIAVCGAGVCDEEVAGLAEAVGRGIGEAGAVLLCGGLGGVMEAAARGAADAGGLTVGFMPDGGPERANPYLTLPLATGFGEGRNVLLVRAADAVVGIAGEWGTLSEVALAMKLGRPVVLLQPVLAAGLGLEQVGTAEEAVARALELGLAARNGGGPRPLGENGQ